MTAPGDRRATRPAGALLWTAAVAGLVLRLVCLPLPGTLDVAVWKIWAFAAATDEPARLYGTAGTGERRVLKYDGRFTTVDYPPGALYVLAAAGHAYRWWDPSLTNGPAFTAAVKAPGVVADALVAWLLIVIGARWGEARRGWWAAVTWWLNPAVVLHGAALGYLDAWFAPPALAALAAAASGAAAWAGAFAALAVLLKAQAVLLVPALALLLLGRSGGRGLGSGAIGGVAVAAAAVTPVLAAGGGPAFVEALGSLTRHDMLSGNAANLWWLVTYWFRVVWETDVSLATALQVTVRILAISTWTGVGYPNPRPIGSVLVLVALLWALHRVRRRDDVWIWAAAGAFCVHAYFVLGAQVHENHLFLALPLAALASIGRERYARVAGALSVLSAVNLFMFYGISEGVGVSFPRGITGIDASVLLAVAGVAALAWHARVFAHEVARDVDIATKRAG